ncbi:MAG: pentapeptide repeat-containing protein, partial [Planktotalea sp.]|uniref:pentapeptide repeat-containing protein n=1 Tax=Planktotalea sp. TaxID=2029877 RepID=UPI003C74BD98
MDNIIDNTALALVTHPFTWIFIALTAAFYLIQSLVQREARGTSLPTSLWDTFGLTRMHPFVRVALAALWAVLFVAFLFGAVFSLIAASKVLLRLSDPGGSNPIQMLLGASKADFRLYLLTLAAMTAGLSAIIALPFTLIRTKNLEANTKATEQGLVTDRLNKAVEGLGAQKEVNRLGRNVFYKNKDEDGEFSTFQWEDDAQEPPENATLCKTEAWSNVALTEPNLEVRIGSIYALERIARENKDYHVQVMEILCAYIRENAPASGAVDWPELEMRKGEDRGPLKEDFNERLKDFRSKSDALKRTLKPRSDIQTALTVLGRRNPEQRQWEAEAHLGKAADTFVFDRPCQEYQGKDDAVLGAEWESFQRDLKAWLTSLGSYRGYRLDLRDTNLHGADLSGYELAGARFENAQMQGADFRDASMQGADLTGARMQ